MKTVLVTLIGAALLVGIGGCASATTRVANGDNYYIQGDYKRALEQYLTARRKDPTIPGLDAKIVETQVQVQLKLADRAIENQKWARAENAYRQVGRLDPEYRRLPEFLEALSQARADFHFERGQRAMAADNPFAAAQEFEVAISFQESFPQAKSALALALRRKAKREELAKAEFTRGQRSRNLSRFEDAITSFNTTLELNPHHPHAVRELAETQDQFASVLIRLGDSLLEAGDSGRALKKYRAADGYREADLEITQRIELARTEVRAAQHASTAADALERGQWELAYEEYSQAIALSREPRRFADGHEQSKQRLLEDLYQFACTEESAGHYWKALEAYDRALTLQEDFRDAGMRHRRLARSLPLAEKAYTLACQSLTNENLVQAEKHFLECAAAIPKFADVATRLLEVRRELGQAEDLYNRAVRAQSRGETTRAIVLFEECLSVTRPYRDGASRLEILQRSARVGTIAPPSNTAPKKSSSEKRSAPATTPDA